MNIETVNELIASLESAGELSIREQKFLRLAKEFRICSASLDAVIRTGNALADQNAQLAAENVALKNPDNWLSLSEYGDKAAEVASGNGASEDEALRVGLIAIINRIETTATDRIVAGIKADGVEEFAAHLRANDNGASVCKMIALGADDFAKQLREGADK
ncbi:hypothetical protein MXM31_19125 [Klebsiella aerogenes]|uniref:hypothetical protein n=1 Tax=Klebsiella aerogenes TaxID=548 RepID=UPI002DB617E9|nr:hypothetical protein [Klebsiella aerogenes]MEB5698272.1 hypothetical protein [Klebsiella aerogenes]